MRVRVFVTVSALALAGLPWGPAGAQVPDVVARDVEPVILTGAQVPTWSRLAATGVADTYPAGTTVGDRDAHHGTITVPPDARAGVAVGQIAAYRFERGRWVEIPVQVDERYPYFLANGSSDFAFYSTVDEELTYAWGDESWLKTAGQCEAAYPPSVGPVPDPVPTLDDDDEIVFMASDAGDIAPAGTAGPPGTGPARQQVTIADPLDPSSVRHVYLFLQPGGSSFDASTGYVSYDRDANADEYIDRYSIRRDDPETLGVSNTGYGPNLSGTVCRTAKDDGYPDVADGEPRPSSDRFPRDGVTVSTDAYRWYASGRWMVRSMQVARPGQAGTYGPDLIDRWKGRAFQQSPDSTISVVGFEDEQINWEANSTLLGELAGPVRAIRETWGADSGTNVTKTETFYRDAITYRYHVRVHPIPPDGLYTSWDYNKGVAVKYYNAIKPDGVAIDGVNDDVGNVDDVGGTPAFFDAPDPTFNVPLAMENWEQVSGKDDAGSLVYTIEMMGPTSAENPLVFPYYRDDKCLDDGTGDDPVRRPWPGETSTDQRVKDGYAQNAGKPYDQVTCDEKQGAWGSHGIHYFFTGDTDNAFGPKTTTEIDAQQWQFAVPTAQPSSVGEPYANTVRAKLRAAVVEQGNTPGPAGPPAATQVVAADVTRDGDTLVVHGDAIFGGTFPVSVGSDPAGDTAHPFPAELGYDLTEAFISQPDPATGDLVFRLDLADLPPSGTLPEVARYFWDFGARDGDGVTLLTIDGKLTDVVRRQRTESPVFILQGNCATDANNVITCEDVALLPTVIDGEANSILITIPRTVLEDQLDAGLEGTVIEAAEIFEGISTAPAAYFSPAAAGDVLAQESIYAAAAPQVSIGLVEAGEPSTYVSAAAPGEGGGFESAIDVAGLTGPYEVVIRACYGNNCDEQRIPIEL